MEVKAKALILVQMLWSLDLMGGVDGVDGDDDVRTKDKAAKAKPNL